MEVSHFTDLIKLQQNASVESCNGGLCDELRNEEIFNTLDAACRKIALSGEGGHFLQIPPKL